MSATYSVADYMAPFLICVLGSIVVIGILCVWLGRVLLKKFRRLWLNMLPIAGYILFMYFLVSYAVPILEQTGDLLVPSEYEMKTTAGQIVSVTPAEHVPLYCIDGKVCDADYVEIDGASYYVISDGSLTEGMLVELQYAHFETDVILQWQEVTEERAAAVLKTQQNTAPTEKPQEQPKVISQETKIAGQVLMVLGFVGLIGRALTRLDRGADYLFRKDAEVYSQILPNRVSVLFLAVPILFILMIALGQSMKSGEYYLLVGTLLIVGVIFTLVFIDQSTSLRLDGRHLLISRLWKERHYTVADIDTVEIKPCRGITRRQMVIIFNDGISYWFNMDYYVGVQNTYNALQKHIEETPVSTERQESGDVR